MTDAVNWDALAADVLANFAATGQWFVTGAPPLLEPVDWDALAAQVLANFAATGQWFVSGTPTPPTTPVNLVGGDGPDSLVGGAGDDTLDGGIADDSLEGLGGADLVVGGPAGPIFVPITDSSGTVIGVEPLQFDDDDLLLGGSGDDVLRGGWANDSLSGGADGDTLFGGWGNDTLEGGEDDDSLVGGLISVVQESVDDNLLHGGGGNDTLIAGGVGNDTLEGGDADDRLSGGSGSNVLSSGAGHDVFLSGFSVPRSGPFPLIAQDRILDFERGSDLMDLTPLNLRPNVRVEEPFVFIGEAPFTESGRQEVRFFFRGDLTVVELDRRLSTDSFLQLGDGQADGTIFLDGRHLLAASDFVL